MISINSTIKFLACFLVTIVCFTSCSKEKISEPEQIEPEIQAVDEASSMPIYVLPNEAENWTEQQIVDYIEQQIEHPKATPRNSSYINPNKLTACMRQAMNVLSRCSFARNFARDYGFLILTPCILREVQLAYGPDAHCYHSFMYQVIRL